MTAGLGRRGQRIGWAELARQARAIERSQVRVPLRATVYRLLSGERLRLSVACANFAI